MSTDPSLRVTIYPAPIKAYCLLQDYKDMESDFLHLKEIVLKKLAEEESAQRALADERVAEKDHREGAKRALPDKRVAEEDHQGEAKRALADKRVVEEGAQRTLADKKPTAVNSWCRGLFLVVFSLFCVIYVQVSFLAAFFFLKIIAPSVLCRYYLF